MEHDPLEQQGEIHAEAITAKLSMITADLKRMGERLLELSARMASSTTVYQNACACAQGETDHVEYLIPGLPGERHLEGESGSKTTDEGTTVEGNQAGESEDESPEQIPQVLDELRRHLSRMDRANHETEGIGCEVGELGYELLGWERDLRGFMEEHSVPLGHPPPQQEEVAET